LLESGFTSIILLHFLELVIHQIELWLEYILFTLSALAMAVGKTSNILQCAKITQECIHLV